MGNHGDQALTPRGWGLPPGDPPLSPSPPGRASLQSLSLLLFVTCPLSCGARMCQATRGSQKRAEAEEGGRGFFGPKGDVSGPGCISWLGASWQPREKGKKLGEGGGHVGDWSDGRSLEHCPEFVSQILATVCRPPLTCIFLFRRSAVEQTSRFLPECVRASLRASVQPTLAYCGPDLCQVLGRWGSTPGDGQSALSDAIPSERGDGERVTPKNP